MAKEFHQHEGLDFIDTFSPVVKSITIWLIISIAIYLRWPLHQWDVQYALLHDDLEEAVLMKQPPGFANPDYLQHVCKLRKLIYDLKQAPRAWFAKLSNRLLTLGFQASKFDFFLFIYCTSVDSVFVLVYLDDIVVTGSNSNFISDLLTALHESFPVKNLGPLHYFLGIEVTQDSQSLSMSQSKYISDLLKRTCIIVNLCLLLCPHLQNYLLLMDLPLKILTSITILLVVYNI